MGSSKPCPGCGEVDNRRKTTEVCRVCQDKLRKYDALQNALEKQNSEKVPVVFAKRNYQTQYFHIMDKSDLNRQLQSAFHELARAATTNAVDYPGRDNLIYILGGGDYSVYGGQSQYGYMPEKLAFAIKNLHELIQPSLDAAYSAGKQHGHNLLGRLATGDIAPNEFFLETAAG